MTIQELAATTHVSAKTIRTTYRALRERLADAIVEEPDRFGGAGLMIAMSESDSVLEDLQRSRLHRRHKRAHAPRTKSEEEEKLLATELLVRILCAHDLRQRGIEASMLERLSVAALKLRPRDPLQKLADYIPGARAHAHPALRLYEDYRRYLLKNPLCLK